MLKARDLVLNSIVERILIISDFKAKGGHIPDNLGKKEYEAIVRQRFNGDRVAFAKYLNESGKTIREFRKDIEENAIVGFILNDVLKSKMEISPGQIREYYDSHTNDFIVDRQVFINEFSIDRDRYGEEELRAKLDALAAALKSGKDMQYVGANFGSFKRNQIGWIAVDQLIPEFSEGICGLQSGDVSGAIVISNRVCLLFISDERPAKKFAISEVSGDIEKILAAKYRAEAKDNYIKKLKERAYIKIFM
jgi:peptidyl-prolyl cis-trans isomerase SurA